jgi:GntR family transcriptional regulator
MLPFSLSLRPGEPIVDQTVYAVTRAIVSGQLRPGDRFPSVRALSQELRVNPNTAQRIVTLLVEQGLLDVQPGVGTIVAAPRAMSADNRRRDNAARIHDHLEPLVVESRRLGLTLQDVIERLRTVWRRLDPSR